MLVCVFVCLCVYSWRPYCDDAFFSLFSVVHVICEDMLCYRIFSALVEMSYFNTNMMEQVFFAGARSVTFRV